MKRITLLMVALILVLQLNAQQDKDAEMIMSKSRDLSIISALSARVALTITEKNGLMRNRTIIMSTKSYPGGQEKRFIRFVDPPDVKGTAMLITDNKEIQDEMWIYLPALKKTRRIVSSEKGKSFMSSEFTNSDMSSPALSDFRDKLLQNSENSSHWVIESTPADQDKADEYGFSRKVSYIGKDNYQVQKMEFYDFENDLFKVIEVKDVFTLPEGKYFIKEMSAKNLKNQRNSLIKFTDIQTGLNISDDIFTLQNLER